MNNIFLKKNIAVVVIAVFAVVALDMAIKLKGKEGEKKAQNFPLSENGSNFESTTEKEDWENLELEKLEFPSRICNIVDYGAQKDNQEETAVAIEKAIGDCFGQGGGTVVVPEGEWKTGKIHLKSHINLRLEKGAQLVFSSNPDDYLPVVFTRFEGMELYNYSPLIYAKDCENVAISGEGKIVGNGRDWKDWNDDQDVAVSKLHNMIANKVPTDKRIFGTKEDALRPNFIEFVDCKNVEIADVKIEDGPMWTVHPLYSENVHIYNLKIETESHNTDGIVVDSSKNVLIENCEFSTGDDAVSIKSGLDEDGWRVGKLSENIVVRRIKTMKGHGSVNIGSEMSGGVKNVSVSDCDFFNTDMGIRIKTLKGRGGVIENIKFSEIRMDDVNNPMMVDFQYPAYTVLPKTETLPRAKNIFFENITSVNSRDAIFMRGIQGEDVLDSLHFRNISIISMNGIIMEDVSDVVLENVKVEIESEEEKSLILLDDAKNIKLIDVFCSDDVRTCLRAQGKSSQNISISGKNVSEFGNRIKLKKDVNKKEINIKQ
jgi:polygalacturonase